jgi:ABC-type uncharacterized transport system fused permease/ATPase subunit
VALSNLKRLERFSPRSFHHAQLRGNAESVALYRGGKSEEQFANSALKNVIDTQQATINRELLVHCMNRLLLFSPFLQELLP